jgi:hypothetical protein
MNLYNLSQKIDAVIGDLAAVRRDVDILRAQDAAPNLEKIREELIARLVELGQRLDKGIATSGERNEHAIINKMLDALAPPLSIYAKKAEDAAATLAAFKATPGATLLGEDKREGSA